jgi:hypothetical protein
LSSPVGGTLEPMARATAFVLILLACGASLLALSTPADAKTKPCWKQVLDDWSDNGRIDGKYSSRCIDEAVAKAPEDVRAYTDFEDQAEQARQESSRRLYGTGGGSDPNDPAPGSESNPSPREPNTGPKDETPVGWVLGTSGNNADSVPIPLLVLLGLAGALITAGGAGFAARKLQARRASR